MKSRFLLALSILLNVVLLGVVMRSGKPTPQEAPAAAPAAAAGVTPITLRAAEKRPRATVVTNTVTRQVDWRAVESEDYKKYIANLRAIGCPEETIKDIIVSDVTKLFEQRRREAKPKAERKKYEFWKRDDGFNDFKIDPEQVAQAQADAKERRALLKQLLGYEPVEKLDLVEAAFGGENPFAQMVDFLEPSRQTQVLEVFFKFSAMEDNARDNVFATKAERMTEAERMEALRKIKREREAELSKLLTPQEKEQFDLNCSDKAKELRSGAKYFDYTEKEFRDIFRIENNRDVAFAALNFNNDTELRNSWKVASEESDAQIKALLGDARYADFKRSQDGAYVTLADFVESQGLPKEAGIKVYDMKKVAQEQAGKVRSDQSLSPEQRAAALTAIRVETERAVFQAMGQKAFDAYSKKASWIQNLNASPKP